MTEYERYEIQHVGERLVRQFIEDKITDMECLAACRKLKSIYDLINRVYP
jgi:hypothetical protein